MEVDDEIIKLPLQTKIDIIRYRYKSCTCTPSKVCTKTALSLLRLLNHITRYMCEHHRRCTPTLLINNIKFEHSFFYTFMFVLPVYKIIY